MMRAYVELVLARRWWFVGAISVITLLAGASMSRGVIESSVEKMFFGNSPGPGARSWPR